MSIFDFLKSSYSPEEQQILELYTQIHIAMGIAPNKAKSMCKDMLEKCIEEAKREGSYYLPQNLGDIILDKAESDTPIVNKLADKIKEDLPKKRAEGVTDEDIKWWWNLNDIERRMMIAIDEINILMDFTNTRERGLNKKEAGKKVRKYHPIYGNSEDTTYTKGDNRPLPYELKDRINIYIEKRAKSDSEQYKKEIEESSTFNALVRKEIRERKI